MDPIGGPADRPTSLNRHHQYVTVSKVVFRTPPTAHLGALLLAVAATPFAFAAPGLFGIYAIPIAMIVWVVRHRTTADTDGLTARDMFTSKTMKWDDLASLKIDRGRVSAVGTDGTVTRLPGVRLRHVSLLSRVSGGRIPDPAADPEASDEESPATPDTSAE
ncbi:PH domain-containing protein [Kibdelosporangium aridum]|uniref:PH domain-containing protein n=1 Tax=Kibdelosporangium aridum TaxID=2030 RepID=A0A428ZBS8_KIBAR|nr:PH domain-containing protein [Kibdelosporangium aridum]